MGGAGVCTERVKRRARKPCKWQAPAVTKYPEDIEAADVRAAHLHVVMVADAVEHQLQKLAAALNSKWEPGKPGGLRMPGAVATLDAAAVHLRKRVRR